MPGLVRSGRELTCSSRSRGVVRGEGNCKMVRSGSEPVLLPIGMCN